MRCKIHTDGEVHHDGDHRRNWLGVQLTSKDIGPKETELVKELLGLDKEYIRVPLALPFDDSLFSGFWRYNLAHGQILISMPTGNRSIDKSGTKEEKEALEEAEELERLFTKNLPHFRELAENLRSRTAVQRLATERGAASTEIPGRP